MKFMKRKRIEKAVHFQLSIYPESNLTDIYKSFFQDYFGPEHLINDPAEAKKNIMSEVNSTANFKGLMLEPTGYRHRFYRVNLSLLHDARIPVDTFMSVFLESSKKVKRGRIEKWIKEWKFIDKIIEKMNLQIQGYEKDRKFINELLLKNEYIVHHSDHFIKKYDPHYRIISKKLFDKKLRKFIYQSNFY